ncbi:hypothetical protein M758_9G152300 [Ceratodon purpureus]|nr:hypothetical protein M758_9G152300 [Ceratodon purpureus]
MHSEVLARQPNEPIPCLGGVSIILLQSGFRKGADVAATWVWVANLCVVILLASKRRLCMCMTINSAAPPPRVRFMGSILLCTYFILSHLRRTSISCGMLGGDD